MDNYSLANLDSFKSVKEFDSVFDCFYERYLSNS